MGCIIGLILNRALPMEPSNLAMELPELTVPSIRNVLFKMWSRTKDFFSIAVPVLIIGSIIVEILLAYNLVTGYIYDREAERKRLRLNEQILTAREYDDRGALNESLRRIAQYLKILKTLLVFKGVFLSHFVKCEVISYK